MSTIYKFLLFIFALISCNPNEYEEVISEYLRKPSKIIAEIESDDYSFIFIANDELEDDDFCFFGDELFIVLDKTRSVLYSDLLYSSSSHQYYYITKEYFVVIFRDRETFKDLIIGIDLDTGKPFRYKTQYRNISGFYKKDDLIYYSAEKYDKCISVLNTDTDELTEYGDEQIVFADFVEKDNQVYIIANSINSYPRVKYYTITDNEMKPVSDMNLVLEVPTHKFLRDHRYDERKFSYLLEKYSN